MTTYRIIDNDDDLIENFEGMKLSEAEAVLPDLLNEGVDAYLQEEVKVFSVGCWQTEHFKFNVEANSEEEALSKAYKILCEEGVPEGAKVFDRSLDSESAVEL
tara:strand:- start:874 stop:1182 length:309 start_codon:yes stop_codon:yes gene_type:complete